MFEKILSVTKNFAIVKVSNNINDDILNYNVILEDNNKKILGEIDEVINNEANGYTVYIKDYPFWDNTTLDGVEVRQPWLQKFLNSKRLTKRRKV